MSRTSKGNYHRHKTQEWLEGQGYIVAPLEVSKRLFLPAKNGKPERVIFSKKDVWGADLVARNEERLVFVQVKANRGDIAKGMRELSQGPWPKTVARWVVHWPERSRIADGPEIEVVA